MATSSKDLETLWKRYAEEGSKQGISVLRYFESNGIPYHVFEKWYKKKFRQPDIVECSVSSELEAIPTPQAGNIGSVAIRPTDPQPLKELTVSYITLCLSNGLKLEHHKLSYEDLLALIQKIKPLCLA